jgi:AraC-like DNA-binding protein
MIGSGTATFTDPGDYQASIAGVHINLVLTGGGPVRARLTWVDLHSMRLLRCRETAPRITYVKLVPGTVVVAFPTHSKPPQMPQIWSGVQLGRRDMVVLSCGEGVHQRTSGASQWGLIILAAEDLAAYGRVLNGTNLVLLPSDRILRPSAAATTSLLRLHAKACRLAEAKPEIIAHHEVVRALEHELLHAVIDCLVARDAYVTTAARRRHTGIMDRFEAVLATHRDRQISTAELCAARRVPERILRLCCAAFLGMSPGSYVRLRRLNHVRATLTRADPATASIAEIAGRHGFSEPGRFAAAYRVAFGEAPSITLRAARARMVDRTAAETA